MTDRVGIDHHYPLPPSLLVLFLVALPAFAIGADALKIPCPPWLGIIFGLFGLGWLLEILKLIAFWFTRIGYNAAPDDVSRLGLGAARFANPDIRPDRQILGATVQTLQGENPPKAPIRVSQICFLHNEGLKPCIGALLF